MNFYNLKSAAQHFYRCKYCNNTVKISCHGFDNQQQYYEDLTIHKISKIYNLDIELLNFFSRRNKIRNSTCILLFDCKSCLLSNRIHFEIINQKIKNIHLNNIAYHNDDMGRLQIHIFKDKTIILNDYKIYLEDNNLNLENYKHKEIFTKFKIIKSFQ